MEAWKLYHGYRGEYPDGKIEGKMPAYIKIDGDSTWRAVVDIQCVFYGEDTNKNLVYAPEIPTTVGYMKRSFGNCSSLIKAPVIPETVGNMDYCFYKCYNLTGDLVINANPTSFTSCLEGAAGNDGEYEYITQYNGEGNIENLIAAVNARGRQEDLEWQDVNEFNVYDYCFEYVKNSQGEWVLVWCGPEQFTETDFSDIDNWEEVKIYTVQPVELKLSGSSEILKEILKTGLDNPNISIK